MLANLINDKIRNISPVYNIFGSEDSTDIDILVKMPDDINNYTIHQLHTLEGDFKKYFQQKF
jgi:hypothetical protein